jgi:hypothetical protein
MVNNILLHELSEESQARRSTGKKIEILASRAEVFTLLQDSDSVNNPSILGLHRCELVFVFQTNPT